MPGISAYNKYKNWENYAFGGNLEVGDIAQQGAAMFGPIGKAISMVSKMGESTFDKMDSPMAGAISKGVFNPARNLNALGNDDFSTKEKLLSIASPFAYGYLNKQKENQAEFERTGITNPYDLLSQQGRGHGGAVYRYGGDLTELMQRRVNLQNTPENRLKLAGQAGIKDYTGTSEQDDMLFSYLTDLGRVTVNNNQSNNAFQGKERIVSQPLSEYRIDPVTRERYKVETGEKLSRERYAYGGNVFSEPMDRFYAMGGTTGLPPFYYGDNPYEGLAPGNPRPPMSDIVNSYRYGGYAMGGYPQYEAEGGEVIEGGNPQTFSGGYISPNSSNAGMINGRSHNQGGVKMSGGERIYSDQIYLDQDFIDSLEL